MQLIRLGAGCYLDQIIILVEIQSAHYSREEMPHWGI
jgi:hypothetical protein